MRLLRAKFKRFAITSKWRLLLALTFSEHQGPELHLPPCSGQGEQAGPQGRGAGDSPFIHLPTASVAARVGLRQLCPALFAAVPGDDTGKRLSGCAFPHAVQWRGGESSTWAALPLDRYSCASSRSKGQL